MNKKNLSLRGTIIFSFMGIIVFMNTIIGGMAYSRWKTSTNMHITEMENSAVKGIEGKIEDLVNIPLYINQMNYHIIENELIDLFNAKEREVYFAGVMKANQEEIYSFSYGIETGEYYGARKNTVNEIEVYKSDAQTKGHSHYFSINEDLTAKQLVAELGEFDPRTREWYKIAKEKKKPTFSSIYEHFVMKDLAITAAHPIYNKDGTLKGVLGTHFTLSKINTALEGIVKDKMTVAYIVENNTGQVVANSLNKPNFKTLSNQEIKGITIEETDTEYIIEAYRDYKNNQNEYSIIRVRDDKLHIKFTQYKREGIDWLIITAIPEGQFTNQIKRDISIFIFSSIIIVILVIIMWIKRTEYFLKPIYNLVDTATQFSKGDLLQRAKVESDDEIGKLAVAFNNMAEKLYALISDLKERKNELELTNTALRRSKIEAEEANKAKSRFLANMSHEIRTPMNGVMGMTQLLLLSNMNSDQEKMVKIIQKSSDALLQIINDILDLSKIEAGKVELVEEVVNVTDLMSRVEKLLSPLAANKNLNYITQIENDVPEEIIVDSVRLTQVITNLVGNAIKFTKSGGIETTVKKLKVINNKVQLIFSIKDTGIGIKEEDIPKLFNYFTQLDDTTTKTFQGTGLGLAISKSIVALLGGEICVESEAGAGSTFYFTCWADIVSSTEKEQSFKDNQTEISYQKKLKVLLVEDDYVSKLIIQKICNMKNWEIHMASNGKKAMEIYEKERFDLILMDIQIPEMSGIDVTKMIREKEKATGNYTPIVAITAYAKAKEEALGAGMDFYMSKPLDIEKLEQVINELVQ